MASKFGINIIVAAYVSSEEAMADFGGLEDFFWQLTLGSYDAVLLVTDAWNQVRVAARSSRTAGDLSIGPLHDGFTLLFGGPFLAGDAPIPPPDRRLSRSALLALGDALRAGSVVVIAVIATAEPAKLVGIFKRAVSVKSQTMPWQEELPDFRPVISELLKPAAPTSTSGQTVG